MIDKTRAPQARGILPAFTPVPRRCKRHDGWTPERQRGFIEALAETGSVRAAAHRVNMTPEGAYLLRRHPQAESFRAAWEAALACGVQKLEDIALERAIYGVEVPVYSYGKLVGTRRVTNDALLMFLLRNRAGERFSADSWQNADAATRGKLERLKAEWRAEWEAERAAQAARATGEGAHKLTARLEVMHQRWLDGMSPKVRALYEAYKRAEVDEKEERDGGGRVLEG